ncbi:hypothetical protein EXIGLDRAFT_829698 [Exidia glandulosa HHB12029]|uniref:Uncharacterized protein n=1 Tax=Exidia glandulosa HHB12029 TaxID=1314781 RepID=A0A165PGN2_EXIGL|nr:hypothetical protein EXIGLDRAFT_829698 [Exidia glandulosa HHB12029]
MVRATRSSAQHPTPAAAPKHAPSAAKQNAKKHASKKRKRPSNASADVDPDLLDDDEDQQPAAKQPRQEPTYKDAADLPLDAQDAQRILNVLESVDAHGLLDRAFPPPAHDEPSSSRAQLSLRQLLEDAQNHPLRVLRDAVQPLFPITSHARSRNSAVAQENLRFCQLALALLEQASRNTLDVSKRTSILLEDGDVPGQRPSTRRKYAMMQKLPNGEWWTSALASDDPRAGLSAREAKGLTHGQAELVSLLPSIVDTPEDTPDVSKLGDYAPGPKKTKRKQTQVQHGLSIPKIASGTFLDYGPYASFAPSFDSDSAEVGRDALGALYDARERRRMARQKRPVEVADDAMQVDEPPQAVIDPALSGVSSKSASADPLDALLDDVLAEVEFETSISELLQRNARALVDLEVMQLRRLKIGAPVEEDSEEWRTAHQILDTLALLAELRPRGPDSDDSPLMPAPEVLHALQRTLPIDAGISWKGTLDEKRLATLRDNNTVRVKVAGTSTTTAATPGVATKAATPAATPQPYRMPYPGPPNPYYPNAQFQTPGGTPAGTPMPYPPWPGFYPYPGGYPAPPPGSAGRDKAMSLEAAQKFYGYAAQGPQANAAKGSPVPPNGAGWFNPAVAGMPGGVPVTLPAHLRKNFPQYPGTPTPAGR